MTDEQFSAAMDKYVIVSWRELDWDLSRPCNDCPFKKSSPFHQGICRNLMEYHSCIERGTFAHTCHKTDNRDGVDGPKNFDGRPQHCAGALIMLLKTKDGMDLQRILAIDGGALDIKKMTAIAEADTEVFTVTELIRFYRDGLVKLLEESEEKLGVNCG